MRKNWKDEEVLNIIKMKKTMSIREVANQTGLSQNQIHYALYNYKFKGANAPGNSLVLSLYDYEFKDANAPEKSLWDRIKGLFS